MNRQRQILIILLLLMVPAMIWSYSQWPRQKTVAVLKYAPGQKAAPAGGQNSAVPASTAGQDSGRVLRLDLLKQEQPDISLNNRNIFKPVFFDETKVRQRAAIKPLPKQIPVMPVALPTPPKRELVKFTFLGFLQMDDQKTVFLSKDKDILLVKKGDVFAGRFKAKAITDHSLSIVVNDTGEEIVVPLIENQTLGNAR